MTTFNDRETAFENKYAHDAEMQFKANARCHKLLGLWAAEKLGKSGDDADAYAKTVVISDLEEAGHEDVVRKVVADLGDKATEDEIRAEMAKCRTIAKAQVFDEA
ncbi:aldolase [Marinosulfonomonas sp. PRT-SC04]|nr:aldolase [Marinosulfonomonas sp. PRT-SC04]